MKKIYILDTNVLLHDPSAFHHFDDNQVVIPLKVLEEVDHFKREVTELGRNARQVSRMLDSLRDGVKLSDGVQLENGGTLRIAFPAAGWNCAGMSPDDQILQLALELHRQNQVPCIVVSKDINMRLKADALGLNAEDYETDRVDAEELYTGHSECTLPAEQLDRFRASGRLAMAVPMPELSTNQYLLIRGENDPANNTVLGRYEAENNMLVKLCGIPGELQSVYPRNKEQQFAMDALLNDHIKVVTIIGKAGTGKTLLAVAAGLHKVMDVKTYTRLLVARPTFAMGKDIGYLPGTLEEKLDPWMQPIYDAFDLIASTRPALQKILRDHHALDASDQIKIEPLTYIRGRSIANQFIIIDEAQNLTPLEVKTIITRVGHGTKIILTGDIYQIDNPYVDSLSNGLSTTVARFRPYGLAAHITLSRGVRSDVAELAANIL